MDIFGLITIPTWLALLIMVVILLWSYSRYELGKLQRLGLPGPKPITFLGNMVPLIKEGFNPTQLKWVRRYGKMFGSYMGHVPVVWISDLDLMQRILIRDFSTFTNRGNFIEPEEPIRSSVLQSDGNHWKFMRSILSPSFSSGKLRQMLPTVQRCCDVLLQHVREKGTAGNSLEMKRMFGGYTLDVIAGTAFGIEVDSQNNQDDPFVKHADKFFANSPFARPAMVIGLMFPFLGRLLRYIPFMSLLDKTMVKFFDDVTTKALTERRKEGSNRQDFLQLMLNAHKDNHEEIADDDETEEDSKNQEFVHFKQRGLSDMELIGNALLFFVAGFDTTATTLTFTAYHLAANPKCQEKVIDEVDRVIGKGKPTYEALRQLEYMDMTISETLRIYPPGTITGRSPASDVTLNGIAIPKNSMIFIPILAVHKDPMLWPDPEKFDPERFTKENQSKRHPMSYLPFGAGPRNCIGMRLAKMEAKMALTTVLQHYRFNVAPETEIPPKLETRNLFFRAKNGVWIKFDSRS